MSDMISYGIGKLNELRDSIDDILPYLSFEVNHEWDIAYMALHREIDEMEETIDELNSQVSAFEEEPDWDDDLEDMISILRRTHRSGFDATDLSDLKSAFASYMRANRNILV